MLCPQVGQQLKRKKSFPSEHANMLLCKGKMKIKSIYSFFNLGIEGAIEGTTITYVRLAHI